VIMPLSAWPAWFPDTTSRRRTCLACVGGFAPWSARAGLLPLLERTVLLNSESLTTFELTFPLARIVSFLRVFVLLSRIAMFAAGSPCSAAFTDCRGRPLVAPSLLGVATCALGRVPQLAASEPFHLRVRVLVTDPRERRQQLVPVGCAKRRCEASGNDCPVGITWRHQSGPRRLSFSTSVVRLIRSNSAALFLLPPVRCSDRLIKSFSMELR